MNPFIIISLYINSVSRCFRENIIRIKNNSYDFFSLKGLKGNLKPYTDWVKRPPPLLRVNERNWQNSNVVFLNPMGTVVNLTCPYINGRSLAIASDMFVTAC